ncbi:hypothetical protein DFP78_113135 [Photobacterium lutimaris]|nr:hypothetical protein DFP78_113135 [Photobacterium lutimaris]
MLSCHNSRRGRTALPIESIHSILMQKLFLLTDITTKLNRLVKLAGNQVASSRETDPLT